MDVQKGRNCSSPRETNMHAFTAATLAIQYVVEQCSRVSVASLGRVAVWMITSGRRAATHGTSRVVFPCCQACMQWPGEAGPRTGP